MRITFSEYPSPVGRDQAQDECAGWLRSGADHTLTAFIPLPQLLSPPATGSFRSGPRPGIETCDRAQTLKRSLANPVRQRLANPRQRRHHWAMNKLPQSPIAMGGGVGALTRASTSHEP
jgi:hypothetical protein